MYALRCALVVLVVLAGGCRRGEKPPASIDAAEGGADLDYGGCGEKPVLVVQDGDAGIITVVALSPNGRILASTGSGNNIALWDTHSGLLLRRVPTDGPPEGLAVSNDGETVAYGWTDKRYNVRVADVSGRRPPRKFDHARGFALSPNGRWCALSTEGEVELHETATEASHELDVRKATALAFDATGKYLAAAAAEETSVIRLDGFKVVEKFKPGFTMQGTYQVHHMPPTRLYFGDGVLAMESAGSVAVGVLGSGGRSTQLPARGVQQFAAGGSRVVWPDMAGKLNAYDARTGETTTMPPDSDLLGTYRLAMSGDGTRLAIAGGLQGRPVVRLRDGQSLAPIRSVEGQTAGIAGIAASGDGNTLVTSSQWGGVVAAWNLRSGELIKTMSSSGPHGASQGFAPVAASGNRIAVGGFMGITVYDKNLRAQHQLSGMVGQPTLVAFSGNDGLVALSPSMGLVRWNLRRPADPPAQLGGPIPASRAAASPDGALVATAGGLGVEVIRTSDGGKLWSQRVNLVITGDVQLAFTPDGSYVVVMFDARDPSTGDIPDSRSRLHIYDAKNGRQVATLEPGTAGPLAVHGLRIAVGGPAPAIVDWKSGRILHRVKAPDQKVTAIAPHPTLPGVVLMAGDGGSTSLVSMESGEVLAILRATTNGEYVTATPHGFYRASVDGARSIAWSFGCPLEAFPFSQFAASYERPDVIKRALQGHPAKAPPMQRPPFVQVAKSPPAETAEDRIRLPVHAASASRVKTVRVFVNGRPAGEQEVRKAQAKLMLDVPLDPGRNRVSVVAYDDAGMSSNPAVADVLSKAGASKRPDLWVVAIGVSRYSKLKPEQQLEVADDDARSVAHAFQSQAGEGKPYAKAHVTTLLDQQVTVQSVTAAVEKLAGMQPRDLAVVFLAGHGVKLSGTGSIFLTSNAALSQESAKQHGVGWDRLSKALERARGRVLVLLDACHSGHLSTENVVPNDALARELSRGDRGSLLVFAAARGRQLSYEVSTNAGSSRGLELAYAAGAPRPAQPMPPQASGHGLFTAAVLEALGGQAIDIDKSRAIELGELVAYTSERVRVMSGGMQTPWIVRQEMFGDFPLAQAAR